MRYITAKIEGTSPYSQSRQHEEPKKDRESPDAHDERTWRSKLHTTEHGMIVIPPMAFKQAMTDASKMLGLQIPGKGKATYTKHFEAGVLCVDMVPIGVHRDEVGCDKIQANSNGIRGSGKRVPRRFPRIETGWQATVPFIVLDDIITPEVFRQHLEIAGTLIGIGRFRPRNGGFYGRFRVLACDERAG